jgi:DNA-binding NtrC family response regulator
VPATIVVLEKNAAAGELIEQALREVPGSCVLLSCDPLEVLELTRRVRIDLLVSDGILLDDKGALLEQLQSLDRGLRVLHLQAPFSLDDVRVAAALALGQPPA